MQTIMNTQIYKENSEEFNAEWFTFKKSSFVNHVDTLYFMIKVETHDWNQDERKNDFIEILRKHKEKAENLMEGVPIFEGIYNGLEVRPYLSAQMYSLHFGMEDKFDVFVCPILINDKMPPIWVQLRSQALWLNGIEKTFEEACNCVERILEIYDMKPESVQENRIDYAYHTNYIQDAINFFDEKNIKEMQISSFMRWHKEGSFYEEKIDCDYFTLGRRKSNNVFFRAYDKTKEVIEQGYKQFFIPIWLEHGLISKFDEYIIRQAFIEGKYNRKEKARCEFYLMYGKDESIKKKISKKLVDTGTPTSWYRQMAKGLVPDITTVVNVEIQTKRKYYDRLDIPLVTEDTSYRQRMYNIIEQMQSLQKNKITSETIHFVNYKGKYADMPRTERPVADWWQRLRSSKTFEIEDEHQFEYFRKYQVNLDIERQKNTTISKMAGMAAYFSVEYGNELSQITDDVACFTNTMNDNDVQKYYRRKRKMIKEVNRKLEKMENEQ